MGRTAYRGVVVHSVSPTELQVLDGGAVVVDAEGLVVEVLDAAAAAQRAWGETTVVELGRKFLVPGLVDAHAHAPQYAQLGLGTDLPLLEWLDRYTFKTESRFADVSFARRVYGDVVRRVLRNGTTSCVWFASLHVPATCALVDECRDQGLHALVGKVCMDRNSPSYYCEASPAASVAAARDVAAYVARAGGPLVGAIVTPRFAISCSGELMAGLGALAAELQLPVQSHISENCAEVDFTCSLHPGEGGYAAVYATRGLLTERTIMAHGVYLTDDELDLFARVGAGIAHCPRSNVTLASGFAGVRNMLARGVRVGLGTDMSGGPVPSVWDAMRGAVEASVAVSLKSPQHRPLSYKEAFHLGTVGGARLMGLEERLGSFAPGKWFSAQVVDTSVGNIDSYGESPEELFQKAFYLLDDR